MDSVQLPSTNPLYNIKNESFFVLSNNVHKRLRRDDDVSFVILFLPDGPNYSLNNMFTIEKCNIIGSPLT